MDKAGASVDAPLIVLLHGVHGCANPSPGNKYGDLARMLLDQGAKCAIVETSRHRRDRETFCEDREAWAHAAFRGKTFLQDHADAVAGIEAAAGEASPGRVWLFGFSLGGIHVVLAAGNGSLTFTPAGIILGGSGFWIRPEAALTPDLPILDTMPEGDLFREAAGRLKAGRLISFYGSLDSTFTEEACRRLVEATPLPPEGKDFVVIEGADHAFRNLRGVPSIKPLEMISSYLARALF
jgi:dienelactone hydrolase